MKTTAADLKKGIYILHNGEIWQVLKTDFNYRGRGSASIRVKIRNVKSGAVLENTTKSDSSYETPDIDVSQMQYLYKDSHALYFMDPRTYEQIAVDHQSVGDVANYLKEGDNLYVLLHDGKPLTIRPPQSVTLKVIEAEAAAKGDTTTAPKKSVVVETGVSVKVPLFIKKGDYIIVNPESGEYVERTSNL